MPASPPNSQEIAAAAWRLFWRDEMPWLLAFALLAAVVLWRFLRHGRRALRNTLLFLVLGLVLELAGSALEAGGSLRAGPWLRDGGVLATGLALIRLAGLVLFRTALPAAGFPAPRIVEEVALLLAYVAWGMLRLRLAGWTSRAWSPPPR